MVEWSFTTEKINERGPYIFAEWSCTNERINERGPYTFVEWLCAYEINKSVGTLIFGQIVVHKRKIK